LRNVKILNLVLKAIDECQQKVAAATHKQAILDQTRECVCSNDVVYCHLKFVFLLTVDRRLEKDVARLTEQLESVRDTAAAVMQQQQLDRCVVCVLFRLLMLSDDCGWGVVKHTNRT